MGGTPGVELDVVERAAETAGEGTAEVIRDRSAGVVR
jgi:hypothetical protein